MEEEDLGENSQSLYLVVTNNRETRICELEITKTVSYSSPKEKKSISKHSVSVKKTINLAITEAPRRLATFSVNIGKYVYFLPSEEPFGDEPRVDIKIFDLFEQNFVRYVPHMISPKGILCTMVVDGMIYAMNGRGLGFESYDPKNGLWKKLDNAPFSSWVDYSVVPFGQGPFAAISGYAIVDDQFILLSWKEHSSKILTHFFMFDTHSRKWFTVHKTCHDETQYHDITNKAEFITGKIYSIYCWRILVHTLNVIRDDQAQVVGAAIAPPVILNDLVDLCPSWEALDLGKVQLAYMECGLFCVVDCLSDEARYLLVLFHIEKNVGVQFGTISFDGANNYSIKITYSGYHDFDFKICWATIICSCFSERHIKWNQGDDSELYDLQVVPYDSSEESRRTRRSKG
ncbi:hypothetical protein O6P43_008784 [Quillaja saponaria]|uniref:Uncharacterized protein n=1 Tax=Quillaja saponaria TaxID=32244 RepID=A0AAD7PWP1_QUISA|nr:hypothetical protein O6P43_008784 [Quillaja saponaria]